MRLRIGIVLTLVLLFTNISYASAIDTIKDAKKGNVQTEKSVADEKKEEIIENSDKLQEDFKESTDNVLKSNNTGNDVNEKKNQLQQQANGNYDVDNLNNNISDGFAMATNGLNGVNKKILDAVLAFVMIPVNICYALYSIGELGLVGMWLVCIILVFLVPKKLIIIRKAGLGFSYISMLYTISYIVIKYIGI